MINICGCRCVILVSLTLFFYDVPIPAVTQHSNCEGSEVVTVQFKSKAFPVQKIKSAVLFRAGMDIDADGAPNAYGPDNRGLDFTINAKNGSKFVGVITGPDGKPVVQQSGPFKGFYVSPTSLHAVGGNTSDPSTYVDATQISYIALPPEFVKRFDVVLGDLAVVTNRENGRSSFAIYADVGPHGKIGEGSVALANALGLNGNPRRGGTKRQVVTYLVFPGSGLGKGKLRTKEEIDTSAAKVFSDWGGDDQLKGCSAIRN